MHSEPGAASTEKIQQAIIREPLTISREATVGDAIALMAAEHSLEDSQQQSISPSSFTQSIRSSCVLVITHEQTLLGILTERDVIGLIAKHQSFQQLPISAVIAQPKLILQESELHNVVATTEKLQQSPIGPIPVVDERDRLVGIITTESWQQQWTMPKVTDVSHSQELQLQQRNPTAPPKSSISRQSPNPARKHKPFPQPEIQQRYQSLTETIPVGIFCTDAAGLNSYANTTWSQITGSNTAASTEEGWQNGLHPDDRESVVQAWNAYREHNCPFNIEYRFQHLDGTVVWVQGQSTTERDTDGQVLGHVLTLQDISARKALEAQINSRNLLLAKILQDEPLNKILEGIIDCVKQQIKDPLCSFVLLDEAERFRHVAARDLPEDYILKTNGAPAGDGIGSCGTAVARKQTIIVTDIATHAFWKDYKEIALSNGLRACWSHPVMASDGKVLGTFALYYSNIRAPQDKELETVAQMASMAGIAIERHRTITQMAQLNQELEQRVQERTAALKASEIQFRQFSENLPGMVYRYVIRPDQSGYFSYVSHGIKEIYEVEIDSVLKDPQSLWASIHPEELSTIRAKIRESVQTLSPLFSEHRLVTPSGMKWVKSMAQPIQQKNGDIFLDGMVIEISDRKAAEASLSQEILRRTSIFNASVDGIHIIDTDGNLLEANASFAEMLGYTSQEVLQLNVSDWEAQWTKEEIQEILQNPASNRDVFETFHRRKDGSTFPVEISFQFMTWEGQKSLVCIGRDISERKATEAELNKSRQKYYSLIQSINGVVWEYDIYSRKFTFVSDQVEKLSGYSIEKWREEPDFWKNSIHPEDRERVESLIKRKITRGQNFNIEYRLIAADGRSIWIYETSNPQTDDSGEIATLSGITIDISDRKNTELKLQQLNQELIRATRLKDEFLANMSHELRTPLNAILGMTEGLKDQILGSINSKQNNALEVIEHSGSHLLELINDILDVAKFESGQLQLNCLPTHIEALCHSSLGFIQQSALKKGIRLNPQISPNLPQLSLDARRMRQVLINLLSNAVKFTPQGGCITLEANISPSENSGSRPKQSLQIAVTDTGIGIAESDIPSLFQPFIQIDSSLNRKFQGTGLGLTLVKQIVELHGGKVGVTSSLEEGSCFSIELPCITASSESSSKPTEAELEPMISLQTESTPLILLAEDNEANIRTMSAYLQAKGYRLLIAKDGKETLDIAQSQSINLILMDIQIPEIDGLNVMKQIRQIPSLASIPIIALTALAMEGDRDRCLAAGATDYLSKPVKLKQLTALMQELLEPQPN